MVVLDHGRVVEKWCTVRTHHTRRYFAALVELEAAGWDWQGVN